jgi:phosphatidylglycerol:prolipoprotein diacylglycerol transferase
MIEFSAKSISIFGFEIFYYGLILMSGVLAGILLAGREAKRKQLNLDFLYDSIPWILFGGIVGARLWHIFTPPPSMVAQGITTKFYLTHPLDAINIRAGGLGIPGAVLGGLLAFFWFSKRKQKNFAKWIDIFTPAIPLGQAIGRWGNFINQEVYGAPTTLPWAIYISPENRLAEFSHVEYYHPIFLYESLWNLGSVFLLLWISRKYKDKMLDGDLFLIYLVTYPTIRILLDFLRLDASKVGGVNANQTFMIGIVVFSVFALIWRHRQLIRNSGKILPHE